MATMFPAFISDTCESNAERKLYHALQQQLDDQIVVYHSVAWNLRQKYKNRLHGEADFVIVHPEHGVIVLEVKGGDIRYEPQTTQWYSNQYEIKNPFEQADLNKWCLLKVFQEQPAWRNQFLPIGHAVAFPDVVVKQQRLTPYAPREIILDQNDLGQLTTWLEKLYQHYEQINGANRLSSYQLEQLHKLLNPAVELQPLLGYSFDREEDSFLAATEEQLEILDLLVHQRRIAICGCAGSGKTVIASEKARRLAEQGFKVLFTCFNRNLSDHIQMSLGDLPGLTVTTFHKLCSDLAKEAKIWPYSSRSPQQEDFIERFPNLLLEAAESLDWKVDAIIIDEAQDFHENWWYVLPSLLRNEDDGIIYAFFDDHQNLYDRTAVPLEIAPIMLNKNCRNTQTIHEYVKSYYRGDLKIRATGPQGRPVETRFYSDEKELVQQLRKLIHELTHNQKIDAEDIIILTPHAPHNSVLARLDSLGNYQLSNQYSDSGIIQWSNIYQFKGLERAVVILIELKEPSNQYRIQATDEPLELPYKELDEAVLRYVGASRAKHHLIVLQEQ